MKETTYYCDKCGLQAEQSSLWIISMTPAGAHFSPGTITHEWCEVCASKHGLSKVVELAKKFQENMAAGAR